MYGLIILFFGFLWWLLWYWTVRLCFFLGKRYRVLSSEKSYKWTGRFIILFLFFTPTYPSLVTSVYRHITFPILCKEMAGYQKLNPVVPESLLENQGGVGMLLYEEVKFIEWEVKENLHKKYAKRPDFYENLPDLPLGLYRVEYWPEGNVACDRFNLAYHNFEFVRNRQNRAKKIAGQCLGITNINELQSKYQLKHYGSFPGEISRFGYKIYVEKYHAIDRFTGEKLSTHARLSTSWPGAWSFMMEGQGGRLFCPDLKEGPSVDELFQKFFIFNKKKGIK